MKHAAFLIALPRSSFGRGDVLWILSQFTSVTTVAEGNCKEASLEELWQLSMYLIASFQKVQNSVLSGPSPVSREKYFWKAVVIASLRDRLWHLYWKQLKSALKLGPFRTTTYFQERNISEKMLSYPACYCINLRCFFQTLYRNAFSSLRDHLWYSPLRSSSDPYWNWVLSEPLYVMFWMPQGQCLFAHKGEHLMETWRYQVTVYAGVGKSPEWWRASVRRASVIALLQTVLYSVLSGPPLISVREIFLKSSCNCLLKGPSLTPVFGSS